MKFESDWAKIIVSIASTKCDGHSHPCTHPVTQPNTNCHITISPPTLLREDNNFRQVHNFECGRQSTFTSYCEFLKVCQHLDLKFQGHNKQISVAWLEVIRRNEQLRYGTTLTPICRTSISRSQFTIWIHHILDIG